MTRIELIHKTERAFCVTIYADRAERFAYGDYPDGVRLYLGQTLIAMVYTESFRACPALDRLARESAKAAGGSR